jgi:hypothetical protein
MNRAGADALRNRDDRVAIQVALPRRRRPDPVCLVARLDV